MHTSSKISADNQRLADLARLGIMDTAPEKVFEDLMELLVQTTGCTMAMLNFVDDKRVWTKAQRGSEITETSKALSICAHTIESDALTVVEDTLRDERFADNPSIGGSGGVRFYAGAPVYAPSGAKIGSVCVLDTTPKSCTPAMRQVIAIVAQQITAVLELREKNSQIAAWAQERLQLEQDTVRRQIKQHEEERELIGYELHENFAQSIAASLQYLALIESPADGYREHVKMMRQILTGLLHGVRQLSSAVFPIGSAGVIREEMFRQFIRQFNRKAGIKATFVCEGDAWDVPAVKLLTLFRIMVEQLHAYELQADAALAVTVMLTVDADMVQLDITAKGEAVQQITDNKIVANSIVNRSHLQNGKVVTHTHEANKKVLSVQLPL